MISRETILLTLVACSAFAVLFSHVSGIVQSFKHFAGIKRFKPFDCEKCTGFWTGVIVFTWLWWGPMKTDIAYLFAILGMASITSLLSITMLGLMKRTTGGSGLTKEQREQIAKTYTKVYGGKEPDMFCEECAEETFRRVLKAAEAATLEQILANEKDGGND